MTLQKEIQTHQMTFERIPRLVIENTRPDSTRQARDNEVHLTGDIPDREGFSIPRHGLLFYFCIGVSLVEPSTSGLSGEGRE